MVRNIRREVKNVFNGNTSDVTAYCHINGEKAKPLIAKNDPGNILVFDSCWTEYPIKNAANVVHTELQKLLTNLNKNIRPHHLNIFILNATDPRSMPSKSFILLKA